MAQVGKAELKGNLKETILDAVNQVGGFANFIKTGDVVLLKPNFNTADPFPASTDFGFLKAVVELVYEAGAKLVMVGDSSTMTLNTRKVMEKLKIFDLQNLEKPARIYVFEEGEWVRKEVTGGRYLKDCHLPEILERADKLILLPCLKTHKYAQFTGSLKLAVGFMKPRERIYLHFRNPQEKIAELNTLIKPDLVIMDARKCFITGGPSSGELREPNLILASAGRVAIDVEGIKIIQNFKGNSLAKVDPSELPQIKKARELKIE